MRTCTQWALKPVRLLDLYNLDPSSLIFCHFYVLPTYRENGIVIFSLQEYIKNLLEEVPQNMDVTSKTRAANHLFKKMQLSFQMIKQNYSTT